ncbi:MAG: PhzF family phenazine biosynthesis protein [Gammaproteobacteria bacterium]|nr:PhzF family phenazine biosynthesis protein [Gammaproteobacteria bacterium]
MSTDATPVLRIAAFADGDRGGNPAGVLIADRHPAEDEMRRIAAEVGYSETAFACPDGDTWRVRYFAPESEVPFCGHATIALGAALATRYGDAVYRLRLNAAEITVEGRADGGAMSAALQSPPTYSAPLAADSIDAVLDCFGYRAGDLNPAIPPARVHGGADHFALALQSRAALGAMQYSLERGRELMQREGLVTILFAWAETPRRFHTRNPFASGGVYEDPATGAATAAFAGYLRDIGWPHEGSIEIVQGEDMGMRSRLHAEIPPTPGSSIRVSGAARFIEENAS